MKVLDKEILVNGCTKSKSHDGGTHLGIQATGPREEIPRLFGVEILGSGLAPMTAAKRFHIPEILVFLSVKLKHLFFFFVIYKSVLLARQKPHSSKKTFAQYIKY